MQNVIKKTLINNIIHLIENGDVLLASGGQDSFIAVWRLTRSMSTKSEFEFQVHRFKNYYVVFDSMIIGHEGWINSLHWNKEGEIDKIIRST